MDNIIYIEADEEIIAVVSKIKKSPSKENFLVIPNGALILQSIVNLKLLKREAEKNKKQIMIVTTDLKGRDLSEKAGILSQESLEKIKSDSLSVKKNPNSVKKKSRKRKGVTGKKRKELDTLGTDGYFDIRKNISRKAKIESRFDALKSGKILELTKAKKSPQTRREREIEKLFGTNQSDSDSDLANLDFSETKPKLAPQAVSSSIQFLFFTFGGACLLVLLILGFYWLAPRADISIDLKDENFGKDIVALASVSASEVNIQEKIIPAEIITEKSSLSLSFNSSGKKIIADQRARGTLTIYNEYSRSKQPLVATTRFLTEDGKLFRLIQGVEVPGMSEKNGKLEAGSIKVEVTADQAGEAYNIGPSVFSIPGFQGNPKYEKFYAKSFNPMVGGGSSGNEVFVVLDEDIEKAKKETEQKLADELKNKIKTRLGEEYVIAEEAMNLEIIQSASSSGTESLAKEFSYDVIAEINVMVFRKKDTQDLMEQIIHEAIRNGDTSMKIISAPDSYNIKIAVEYGKADYDFEKKEAKVRAYLNAKIIPIIDLEDLKSRVLGKNSEELEKILNETPQVEQMEVEYWPKFFSQKIPSWASRVNVRIVDTI